MIYSPTLKLIILSGLNLIASQNLYAQIIPDDTLGNESSIVTPSNGQINIEGGAIRINNLFHSFREFNINQGQSADFVNPNGVTNIFSRITGNNPSQIMGTLGVLGNANLFFLNPNGILFGANSRLDIQGSFFATTAESFLFENGQEFSAVNPNLPPLLTIKVQQPIGIQFGNQAPQFITNKGRLEAGNNLTLSAGNLNLQGQLLGNNIRLEATNTIQIQDNFSQPFQAIALSKLQLQGNQRIEIFALNHPDSRLVSGKEMTLRSGNGVNVDARFQSGDSFQIEQIDGSLGNWRSLSQAQIQARKDVQFNNYEGSSLQILAGGKVEVTGTIILSEENKQGVTVSEQVLLSDGETVVNLNNNNPLLDIRSGVNLNGQTSQLDLPSSTDIRINEIISEGGIIFLTNQYQSNPNSSGSILLGFVDAIDNNQGGVIFIDSKEKIILNDIIRLSGLSNGEFISNGGDAVLLATEKIELSPFSGIISEGLLGGNITLKSQGKISMISSRISNDNLTTLPNTRGGDIKLIADTISLTKGSLVGSLNSGSAQGGDVIFQGKSNIFFDESAGGIQVLPTATGNGGNVILNTDNLSLLNGSEVLSLTFGAGNAGNLTVNAQSIQLENSFLSVQTQDSFSPNAEPATGNGGILMLNTDYLRVTDGAQIIAGTLSAGNGGELIVNANSVELIGSRDELSSGLFSAVNMEASGNGGNIILFTETLIVKDGATINVSTQGKGNAGNLSITAKSIELSGVSPIRESGIAAEVDETSTGNGGSINIQTETLSIKDQAQITAETNGNGNAGNITLKIADILWGSGQNTGLFANTTDNSTGNGGSIFIIGNQINLENGARITVDSQGIGIGVNIVVDVNNITLNNAIISAENTSNTGGDINLQVQGLLSLRNGSQISTTAGTAQAGGDGGNITLETNFITAIAQENSDITANAFLGNGGKVSITTNGLFGLEFREQLTPLSDITATSTFGLAGIVEINNPNADLTQGFVKLTETPEETKFVEGCQASGEQEKLAFFEVGKGGLLITPEEPLNREAIITPWLPLVGETEIEQNAVPLSPITRNDRQFKIVDLFNNPCQLRSE